MCVSNHYSFRFFESSITFYYKVINIFWIINLLARNSVLYSCYIFPNWNFFIIFFVIITIIFWFRCRCSFVWMIWWSNKIFNPSTWSIMIRVFNFIRWTSCCVICIPVLIYAIPIVFCAWSHYNVYMSCPTTSPNTPVAWLWYKIFCISNYLEISTSIIGFLSHSISISPCSKPPIFIE
ncbi:hypothetical protein Saur03_02652 [Staphylococcus aureus]|nr:Uncharacterised protein [Staphylococcus aureus]